MFAMVSWDYQLILVSSPYISFPSTNIATIPLTMNSKDGASH